ncbi:MAG TPA: hypothetical protein VGO76_00625 [Luteibacter sp.]|jgi:hypothetical protein|nr:hypothetical protein [Luteibacter sp.]
MEARIDRLDRCVERIDADLTGIKVSIGKIEAEMKHVATKTWVLLGALAVMVTVLGAAWWVAQQYLQPILQGLGGT